MTVEQTGEAVDTTKYRGKSLLITGLGTFLGTLDASIVNVSLPTISRELGTTIDMVGWVVLSYSIIIISLLMVFGAISEKKGFQFSYTYGYLIFVIGSALCGLSPHIYFLIFSRVIQGIGASLMIAVGPALVTRSFPASERGRALSVIGMVVSTGLMLGPPLGGYIISWAGWRWIFYVNIPTGLLGFYFTLKYIRGFPISNPGRKISLPGSGSLSLGMFCLMMAILLYSRAVVGLDSGIAILVLSVMFFGLFLYFESNPKTRLIGLDIFRNRVFSFSGAAMFLVFVSLSSVTILMPFYLEQIKHLTPDRVGLFLMTIPVCGFFLAPAAGYLSDKLQARLISTSGVVIMIIGILLLRRLSPLAGTSEIILVLLFIGIGMGFFSTPNTSSIMGSVKKIQLGTAAGILATIRSLGLTFGVGIAIAVFSFRRGKSLNDGTETALAFMTGYQSVYNLILFVIIAAAIFSLVRGKNLAEKPPNTHQ
ncbi:MAG: MFS transporter [Candidatus Zixiibacteriota bacterium]|nr:MAG: MFS transporter [candidate division Zixibacteria bacterium]